MLSKTNKKINPNLRRTLLLLFGIPLITLGFRGLFSCDSSKALENRLSKVENKVEDKEFAFAVDEVIRELSQHPEYADRLFEASMKVASRNNSYSNDARMKMFYFVAEKMRQNPELAAYLPVEVQQHMKRRAINESASKVWRNVRDGAYETSKILNGE